MKAWCMKIFMALLGFGFSQAFAQTTDSLLSELETTVSDVEKVHLLNRLSDAYALVNQDSVLYYSHQALDKARSINSDQGMLDAYMNIAFFYCDYRHNNEDSTKYYFQRVLDIHRDANDLGKMALAFLNLGSTYYHNDNYPLAIKYCMEAKQIYEQGNYSNELARALSLICEIYNYMGNNELAIDYCVQSLQIFDDYGIDTGRADLANTMGSVHYDMKDYPKAEVYWLQATEIARKNNNDYPLSSAYLGLGEVALKREKYDSALIFFERALELDKKNNEEEGISYSFYKIGKTYVKQEKYEPALDLLESSLQLAEKYGNQLLQAGVLLEIGKAFYNLEQYEAAITFLQQSKNLAEKIQAVQVMRDCYQELAKYYNKIEDLETALAYFKLIILTDEKMYEETAAKRIAEIETKYDLKTKDKEIQLLKQEQEFQRLEADQRELINYGLVIGIIVITTLGLVLFNQVRLTKRSNKELEQKNDAIFLQKEELEGQRDEIAVKSALLEENSQNITDSIVYAKKIQLSLLPERTHIKEFFPDSFVFFRPKDIVSGDFYWLNAYDNKVILAALDCTGHGVPGAFMTLLANSLLNQLVIENRTNAPNVMLSVLDSKIKQALHQQNGVESTIADGMDMAVCMVDLNTLEVCYSGAKMPVYYTQDGCIQQLDGDRHSLGGTDHTEKFFTNHFVQVNRGEMLYLASDGFQDQFGGSQDRKFMRKKFRHVLAGIQHLPTSQQYKNVEQIYDEWKGRHPQTDDVMVVGIRL